MKKIFKILVYIFFFIFISLFFLPKSELYNFLEKQLLKEKVIISNEKLKENLLGITVNFADIYYEGINIANVEKTTVSTYLLYNKIAIKNARLLDSFKSMFPSPISNVYLTYSVLDYKNIQVEADGIFGKAQGSIDLINKKVFISIDASRIMKNSYSNMLRQMTLKDGRYLYEYKF